MKKLYSLGLGLALFMGLGFSTVLGAATITFTGAGDGSTWQDAANWDTGTVPTFNDQVIIDGAFMVTIVPGIATADELDLSGTAKLTVSGGASLIFNSLTMASVSIDMEDMSSISNYGTISILGTPGSDGIETNDDSQITNHGIINISNAESNGIDIRDRSAINNYGYVSILESEADGMDINNQASFYNYGSLVMTLIEDEGINMDDSTTFINTNLLDISDPDGNDGICMDDDESYFENSGTIYIRDVINTGEGLEVDDGLFYNTETGVVNLLNITGDAIRLEDDGVIENAGVFNLVITPPDNDFDEEGDGLDIESDATFINYNEVNISATALADDFFAIDLEGEDALLDNKECGVINITSNLPIQIEDSGADFINDGVFATVFDGTNINEGTIDNEGTIIAPNGFMVAPNAVTGGGTITTMGQIPAVSACVANTGAINCSGTTFISGDTYTQTADGCLYVNPFNSDKLSYALQELCGDGEIVVNVASITPSGWGGVTFRESVAAGSKKVQLMRSHSQMARREVRTMTNGAAYPQQFPAFGKTWLRLQRQGHFFRGYISTNGYFWQQVMVAYVPMNTCVEVGVVSTNFSQFIPTTVVFTDVDISGGMAPLVGNQTVDANLSGAGLTEQINADIFPNPTSGPVTLTTEAIDEGLNLEVFNPVGQLMQTMRFDAGEGFQQEVDLTGLPAGVYYFHLTSDSGDKKIEKVILK